MEDKYLVTESKILLAPFGLRNYLKDIQGNFLGCWACAIAWFCCGYKGIYICTKSSFRLGLWVCNLYLYNIYLLKETI